MRTVFMLPLVLCLGGCGSNIAQKALGPSALKVTDPPARLAPGIYPMRADNSVGPRVCTQDFIKQNGLKSIGVTKEVFTGPISDDNALQNVSVSVPTIGFLVFNVGGTLQPIVTIDTATNYTVTRTDVQTNFADYVTANVASTCRQMLGKGRYLFVSAEARAAALERVRSGGVTGKLSYGPGALEGKSLSQKTTYNDLTFGVVGEIR